MPYKIVKTGYGFKVQGPHNKTYSKHPMTKHQAEKQRVAMALSEAKMTHKPASLFFG